MLSRRGPGSREPLLGDGLRAFAGLGTPRRPAAGFPTALVPCTVSGVPTSETGRFRVPEAGRSPPAGGEEARKTSWMHVGISPCASPAVRARALIHGCNAEIGLHRFSSFSFFSRLKKTWLQCMFLMNHTCCNHFIQKLRNHFLNWKNVFRFSFEFS